MRSKSKPWTKPLKTLSVKQSLLIAWHLSPVRVVETSGRTPHSERTEEVQQIALLPFRKPVELLDHGVGF